jgi:hypothetical protein
MIRIYCNILLLILLFCFSSCSKSDMPTDCREYTYNFSLGTHGWDSLLQSRESNSVMQMIGTIGVQDNTTAYTLINRNNIDKPIKLKTNDLGELWLMIGTDSGFEGITALYFSSIIIKLNY